jgi:hypothetical protein
VEPVRVAAAPARSLAEPLRTAAVDVEIGPSRRCSPTPRWGAASSIT